MESQFVENTGVVVRAAGEDVRCDFVIVGTGYYVDLAARAELADFHDKVLLWRDRFVPDAGDEDDFLGAHPYLGAGHEYLGKVPDTARTCATSTYRTRQASSASACRSATCPA